jgi:hypothetical protein
MTDDIRQSLTRLEQIAAADLKATEEELTTLLVALRKEVEAQTGVLNSADSTHPAYNAAASDLVGLLQLTQAVVDAKTEVGKLTTAAGKAVQRVLKKAPK